MTVLASLNAAKHRSPVGDVSADSALSPLYKRPAFPGGIVLRSGAAGAVVSFVGACCVPLFGIGSRFVEVGSPRVCVVRAAYYTHAACVVAPGSRLPLYPLLPRE
ncbi:hypothetical protein HPB50_017182 [Hyalomma asiaticum]|uniref:Uncharacterized protein n=1 Tax=Hyalomma asiaticum TaxID=266040 RepID=A0ACB7TJZ2_HYAAI|nr:hypothetical protein HPB50_017182 [Hyalomma asiaticum]